MAATASSTSQGEVGDLACGDSESGADSERPQGPRLHREVPPERWCVTRQDLRDLRSEVWAAVRALVASRRRPATASSTSQGEVGDLVCGDSESGADSERPQGPRLHREVPPERWCVTRQDLRDLRSEVWAAVRALVASRRMPATAFSTSQGEVGDLACGDSESGADSERPQGPRLHREVPPERWCVTRQDLRDLRSEVWAAVRRGDIEPTPMDNFDPTDNAVGPNFYTVVAQHIKKVTAKSLASWALQRHPDGLDCDLFITHAWAEGTFEFIDKVLTSWPHGAKHAWICTVSMPQHLDISELIHSPRESPFAKALCAARQVLVVPNQRCSIYARLWCVYEAFLAQQQGKVICTAVGPHVLSTLRRLAELACAVFAGFITVASGIPLGLGDKIPAIRPKSPTGFEVSFVGAIILMTVFLDIVQSPSLRGVLNIIFAFVMSCLAFLYIGCKGPLRNYSSSCSWCGLDTAQVAIPLSMIAYCVVVQVDLGRLAAYETEAMNLKKGFEGSVDKAECTSYADKAAIWAEIGNAGERVDRTIDILMRAKVSTPLWSGLADKGFDVQDAAFLEWTDFVHGAWQLVFTVFVALLNVFDVPEAIPLVVVGGLANLFWVVLMCRVDQDRRSFSLRAFRKASALSLVLACVFMWASLESREGDSAKIASWGFAGIALINFFFSSIPPLLLIRIPYLGHFVGQLGLRHIKIVHF